jgi:hypothetical protein
MGAVPAVGQHTDAIRAEFAGAPPQADRSSYDDEQHGAAGRPGKQLAHRADHPGAG